MIQQQNLLQQGAWHPYFRITHYPIFPDFTQKIKCSPMVLHPHLGINPRIIWD